MITNTILYMALIVTAILLINSIKDSISMAGFREAIGNGVLSPRRIMRGCEKKGFDAGFVEDDVIYLTQENNTHYYIYRKHPYIVISKGGVINDDVDMNALKSAIKENNNLIRPTKITMKDNIVYFTIFDCNPIPWNFYRSFNNNICMFEKAEQELEDTYLDLKDGKDISS